MSALLQPICVVCCLNFIFSNITSYACIFKAMLSKLEFRYQHQFVDQKGTMMIFKLESSIYFAALVGC